VGRHVEVVEVRRAPGLLVITLAVPCTALGQYPFVPDASILNGFPPARATPKTSEWLGVALERCHHAANPGSAVGTGSSTSALVCNGVGVPAAPADAATMANATRTMHPTTVTAVVVHPSHFCLLLLPERHI